MKNKLLLAAAMTMMTGMAMAEKTLKIGIEAAYPPFSQKSDDGTVSGFDIDIANALCEQMKRKCELVEIDWDGLIPALKGRKIDAIIASMKDTAERRKSIDFTDRYYREPGRAVRKKDSGLAFDKNSMKGKVIGVQTATTFDRNVTDLFGDVAEIKRYTNMNEVYLDLLSGRLDAGVASPVVLKRAFLDKDGGEAFEFFGPELTEEKYHGKGTAIGIRQNADKLKTAFNQAIKDLRENGKYKTINDKYFDFDIYGE